MKSPQITTIGGVIGLFGGVSLLILYGSLQFAIFPFLMGLILLYEPWQKHLTALIEQLQGKSRTELDPLRMENPPIPLDSTTRTNPRVFVSYSWESEPHHKWVIRLCSDLQRKGIEVIIDTWNLGDFGNDLHRFMESSIRDSHSIILVCTPTYCVKANERTGGVGVESTIITGEFHELKNQGKYVPIVREYEGTLKSSLPTYIKSQYAIDFSKDSLYEEKLEELLRIILKKPKYKKPKLGMLPKLESKEL